MAYMTVTNTLVNGNTADAGELNTNFSDVIAATSDGTKDMNINALTCAGAVAFNGNTTLGNATSDTVTFTARVASSVLPSADDTYDLGSAALQWRQLYADDITVNATTLVTDAANGRVGIGTASPSTNFHLDANGGNTALHTLAYLSANQGEYGAARITLQASRNDSIESSRYAIINADDENSTARQLKIQENGGDTYFGGNVGIGGVPTTVYGVQHLLTIFADNGIGIKTSGTSGTRAVESFEDGDGDNCGRIIVDQTADTTNYSTSSDMRLKSDLGDWNAIDLIKAVNARKYERLSNKGVVEYGFYAQELNTTLPQAVEEGSDLKTDPWSVDYSQVTGVLWKAIQELSAKNDEQQTLIESLTSRIEALEAK
jgi:hypothetical protein